jgi:two-component system OmpR family response regulator
MRLLLIEDDIELINQLRPQLQKTGFAVEVAQDGVDGEFLAQEESFDGIILDLGLPKRPGLEVLSNLRGAGVDTPIVILTARDSWQEKVDGLKHGADDYLTKPFHFEELQARIEAVMRRNQGRADNTLVCRGVTLNVDTQQATDAAGQSISLTGKEFRLLRYLITHAGKIVSKSELSEHVYEEEMLKDSNVIEVYINRLRQYFGKEFIETKRGQGYIVQLDASE